MTTAEKHFNNLVDKITCSVDYSQPPSRATPGAAQWAHEQSVCGGSNGGQERAQHYRFPLTQACD